MLNLPGVAKWWLVSEFQATLFFLGGGGGTCKKLIKEFISRFTFYFVKCKVVNHQVRGEQGAEYFGHEL